MFKQKLFYEVPLPDLFILKEDPSIIIDKQKGRMVFNSYFLLEPNIPPFPEEERKYTSFMIEHREKKKKLQNITKILDNDSNSLIRFFTKINVETKQHEIAKKIGLESMLKPEEKESPYYAVIILVHVQKSFEYITKNQVKHLFPRWLEEFKKTRLKTEGQIKSLTAEYTILEGKQLLNARLGILPKEGLSFVEPEDFHILSVMSERIPVKITADFSSPRVDVGHALGYTNDMNLIGLQKPFSSPVFIAGGLQKQRVSIIQRLLSSLEDHLFIVIDPDCVYNALSDLVETHVLRLGDNFYFNVFEAVKDLAQHAVELAEFYEDSFSFREDILPFCAYFLTKGFEEHGSKMGPTDFVYTLEKEVEVKDMRIKELIENATAILAKVPAIAYETKIAFPSFSPEKFSSKYAEDFSIILRQNTVIQLKDFPPPVQNFIVIALVYNITKRLKAENEDKIVLVLENAEKFIFDDKFKGESLISSKIPEIAKKVKLILSFNSPTKSENAFHQSQNFLYFSLPSYEDRRLVSDAHSLTRDQQEALRSLGSRECVLCREDLLTTPVLFNVLETPVEMRPIAVEKLDISEEKRIDVAVTMDEFQKEIAYQILDLLEFKERWMPAEGFETMFPAYDVTQIRNVLYVLLNQALVSRVTNTETGSVGYVITDGGIKYIDEFRDSLPKIPEISTLPPQTFDDCFETLIKVKEKYLPNREYKRSLHEIKQCCVRALQLYRQEKGGEIPIRHLLRFREIREIGSINVDEMDVNMALDKAENLLGLLIHEISQTDTESIGSTGVGDQRRKEEKSILGLETSPEEKDDIEVKGTEKEDPVVKVVCPSCGSHLIEKIPEETLKDLEENGLAEFSIVCKSIPSEPAHTATVVLDKDLFVRRVKSLPASETKKVVVDTSAMISAGDKEGEEEEDFDEELSDEEIETILAKVAEYGGLEQDASQDEILTTLEKMHALEIYVKFKTFLENPNKETKKTLERQLLEEQENSVKGREKKNRKDSSSSDVTYSVVLKGRSLKKLEEQLSQDELYNEIKKLYYAWIAYILKKLEINEIKTKEGIKQLDRLLRAHERSEEPVPYEEILRQLEKTVEAYKSGTAPLSAYAKLDDFKDAFEKFKKEYDPTNKEQIKDIFAKLLPPKLSSRFSYP